MIVEAKCGKCGWTVESSSDPDSAQDVMEQLMAHAEHGCERPTRRGRKPWRDGQRDGGKRA